MPLIDGKKQSVNQETKDSVDEIISSNNRIKFDFHLLQFGLIKYSLKSISLPNQTNNQVLISKKRKYFHYLVKINIITMLIMQISKLFINDKNIKLLWLVGDVCVFFGGKRYFYSIINIILASQIFLVSLLFKDSHHVNWMINFSSMQGLVPPKVNKIYKIEHLNKLTKKFKIVFTVSTIQSIVIPLIAFFGFSAMFYFNVTIGQYLMYWFFWHFYYTYFWTYLVNGITQYTRSYFVMVCYYHKLRFEYLNERLNYWIEFVKELKTLKQKILINKKLLKLMKEADDIMISISKANQFWNYFLAIFYSFYIILISFVLTCIIYFNINKNIIPFAYAILFSTTMTLTQISISAAQVNYEAKKVGKTLIKFLSNENATFKLKYKVS